MEIILLILAVHSKDPSDIPGRVQLSFSSIEECEKAKNTLSYELKFKQFILEAKCVKRS